MVDERRYGSREEQEEGRPRRRAPKKGGPPFGPIALLCAVLVGAILIARMAAKDREERPEVPKVDASTVFGDLPEEEPPETGAGRSGRRRSTNRAPSGLAQNSDWIAALHKAEKAAGILARAKQAKTSGDRGEWNRLGNLAKEGYDEAIIMTALWEEQLLEKYGETDRQVRDIMRTRNKWFELLRALHKTTGRD
ncbi:MAG: hypothetical protein ABGY71_00985 [bacterium]|jgi:hypothetical protein|nr:hypothetical protein [Planctomycetota bacterium]HIL52486.1 hypothetical protein [Planctomycetota bacterium]